LPGSAHWRQVAIRPGEHPMAELDAALAAVASDGDERIVIYVDQFEEIFTTSVDVGEVTDFVEALMSATREPDRFVVVLCLRGDFYAQTAAYPDVAQALSANHVIVGPMSPNDLRRAIDRPARRAGLRVESALVDRLLEEVAESPGALPLLSTALVELWAQRSGGWIRLEAHEATGGLNGAVARRAEESYAQLIDEERAVAPAVFLRLVGPGEGDAVTRRRVSVDEFDLAADPSTAGVIWRFTQDRLLTADDRTIEVAHEALLREWPRLRTWLAEDTQGRELHAHLIGAARMWEESGEDDSELYRGARLSASLEWSADRDRQLNELERRFLESSRQAGERESRRQRRSNRRLRALLAGVALFLVVALVAGALALVQRGNAAEARNEAQARALQADAERVGAQARIEPGLDRAMLMAVAGVKLDDTPEARANLLATLERSPAATHVIRPVSSMGAMALSPDGSLLAVCDLAGVVTFWSLDTWSETGARVDLGAPASRRAMEFSIDGRTLFAGAWKPNPKGWSRLYAVDVATRTTRVLASWPLTWSVTELATSPDGSRVAVGLSGLDPLLGFPLGRLLLIDPSSGRAAWHHPYPHLPNGSTIWLAFSRRAAGPLVTSAEGGGETYVWDVATGRRLAHFDIGGPVALSPDGRFAAVARNRGSDINPEAGMTLLDLHSGKRRVLQGDLNDHFVAIAFTPDGRSIVAGSASPADSTIHLWDVRVGRISQTFTGQSGAPWQLALSGDGRTLLSGADDGSIVVWDLSGTQRLGKTVTWGSLESGCRSTPCAVINRQGTLMAASGSDGSTYLVDLRSLEPAGHLPVRDGAGGDALAFFPDGRTLATAHERFPKVDHSVDEVTLWDTRTMRSIRTLHVDGYVESLAASPDGATLAVMIASKDHLSVQVRLWDVATWRAARAYEVGPAGNWDNIAFSPNGRELAASTSRVTVWDMDSREELFRRDAHDSIAIGFAPDGRLAVGTAEGDLVLLDARSGRPAGSPIHASGGIYAVDFSRDGATIALSTLDLTASLWDLASEQRLGTFPTDLTGPVAIFTPKGAVLVIYEGWAAEWPLDLGSWERYACQVAGRDFTPEEWAQLLPGRPYQQVCS
jgi:WD40 repeat protein